MAEDSQSSFHPEKVKLNFVTHSVRAAQAVLQYGVGAMVDFPSQTLMTSAPEEWDPKNIRHIHDERLQKVLKVEYFGCPTENRSGTGIGYVQFPRWYFCPQCRKFAPWETWYKNFKESPRGKKNSGALQSFVRQPICPLCKGRQSLVVSRVVVACRHGHIDDFPWEEWCHIRSGKPMCGEEFLTLSTAGTSSEGLESIQVKCACGAHANLKGIFSKGGDKKGILEENGLMCKGHHPWKLAKESCTEPITVLQRGSSSVYFPATFSSLVIPPYSSKLTSAINASPHFSALIALLKQMDALGADGAQLQTLKDTAIGNAVTPIASEIGGVRDEDVKNVLQRILIRDEGFDNISSDKDVRYRREEYDTLAGTIQLHSIVTDDDFSREATNIADYDLPGVKQVVLVPKIREVQALVGFSRISPVAGLSDREETASGDSSLVSVKKDSTNWYPGYEVRGEGIFIEFDTSWFETKCNVNGQFISERLCLLQANYNKSFAAKTQPDRKITSRYLFLHTLSHLLIKRLSYECGYSIASLKERLYCAEDNSGYPMFGLLIYTATGDSEGTLGGLVRQGKADRFRGIFIKAVESAVACSNDPVCNLSHGQGRGALNLSACYACSLVPETSCEDYNTLLDRGVLIGTLDNPTSGVYSAEIANHEWHSHLEKLVANSGSITWPIKVDGYTFREIEDEERQDINYGCIVLKKGLIAGPYLPSDKPSEVIGVEAQ